MDFKLFEVKTIATEKMGALSVFEGTRDVPFEIRRIYYIYDTPNGGHRGGHAHRNLYQVLFCPYGKIEIVLDDSTERKSVMLDSPGKGLLIGPGLWREMLWRTAHAVLCVAASEFYDENDYIRDYQDFLDYKKESKYD